jgi:hypothetical protein
LLAKNLPATDENAVLYAMFPTETERVIKGEKPPPPPKIAEPSRQVEHPGTRYVLNIGGTQHEVVVEEVSR